MSPATLRGRIRAGEQLTGTLLRMPNEALVELTGLVGLDLVVLDGEHGPLDGALVQHHVVAAQAHGLDVLVRVPAPVVAADVLRVLDLGATGIVVPHVDSVAEAQAAVRAAHYPPRGVRGFATYTRAGRYGLTGAGEHLAAAAERTVVVAMVESRAGVAAAGAIADVEGVDAVFVGPADLALDLGHPGEPRHPEVVQAIADVDAAVRGRCAVMAIVADAAGAAAAADRGATIVVHNVQAALDSLFLSFARAGTPAAPEAPG